MKNLIFCVLLMIAGVLTLNAQTEAGKVLVGTSTNLYGSAMMAGCANGASFGYFSNKMKFDYDGERSEMDLPTVTAFNLSPRVGVFAIDNLLVGTEFYADWSKTKMDYSNGVKRTETERLTAYAVGPFARYYLDIGNFKPYVQAGMSVGRMREKYIEEYGSQKDEEKYKYDILNFGGGLGGAVFLNDKVSFDVLAQYSRTQLRDVTEKPDYTSRRLSDGFTFGLGLSIFL